ncbi:Fic family protein [Salegentibacter tibetensis]
MVRGEDSTNELQPFLTERLIEMTLPEKSQSSKQRYR